MVSLSYKALPENMSITHIPLVQLTQAKQFVHSPLLFIFLLKCQHHNCFFTLMRGHMARVHVRCYVRLGAGELSMACVVQTEAVKML